MANECTKRVCVALDLNRFNHCFMLYLLKDSRYTSSQVPRCELVHLLFLRNLENVCKSLNIFPQIL